MHPVWGEAARRQGVVKQKGRGVCGGGESLSSAFTQTRLFWPDGVKILFLMLTYLSTLRSKAGFFLVRPEKCVFCKFAQHQPSPSLRSGEFKEGDATTSSSWRLVGKRQKGNERQMAGGAKSVTRGGNSVEDGKGLGRQGGFFPSSLEVFGEPVGLIYANPTFLA